MKIKRKKKECNSSRVEPSTLVDYEIFRADKIDFCELNDERVGDFVQRSYRSTSRNLAAS